MREREREREKERDRDRIRQRKKLSEFVCIVVIVRLFKCLCKSMCFRV